MPASASSSRVPHIVSPVHDAAWFLGPGVAGAAAGILVGLQPGSDAERSTSGLGLWIVGVLLVDVAHVYASLYRSYFDPVARARHRTRLIATPLLCAWVGTLLHLQSALLFWSVLAYVAIFHFIKQHLGFALLFVRAGGEGALDRKLVTAAVWAGTAGPVVHWHAHLPTRFAWFMPGDLVGGAPEWVGTLALWGQVPIWLAFLARRVQRRRHGHRNPLLEGLVLLPALNWHLGIVVFNDDRVFTITNVFLHGIPYLALVWTTGGRERVRSALPRAGTGGALLAFYGLVAALAIGEEALWDRLVWHDHPALFGSSPVTLSATATAIVVAILTVPQATHYVLDRWIWRVGPTNPALARQLRFEDAGLDARAHPTGATR